VASVCSYQCFILYVIPFSPKGQNPPRCAAIADGQRWCYISVPSSAEITCKSWSSLEL